MDIWIVTFIRKGVRLTHAFTITATWEKKPIVVMVPGNLPGPAPVLVFMHGLTAEIGMMQENLMGYASHGFVTLFPYIEGLSEQCEANEILEIWKKPF